MFDLLNNLWDWAMDGMHNAMSPRVAVRDLHTITTHAKVPPHAEQVKRAEKSLTKMHDKAHNGVLKHTNGLKSEKRERRNAKNGLRAVDRMKQHIGQ